jgi:hypothetical protein
MVAIMAGLLLANVTSTFLFSYPKTADSKIIGHRYFQLCCHQSVVRLAVSMMVGRPVTFFPGSLSYVRHHSVPPDAVRNV